jgi:hypothetical protein
VFIAISLISSINEYDNRFLIVGDFPKPKIRFIYCSIFEQVGQESIILVHFQELEKQTSFCLTFQEAVNDGFFHVISEVYGAVLFEDDLEFVKEHFDKFGSAIEEQKLNSIFNPKSSHVDLVTANQDNVRLNEVKNAEKTERAIETKVSFFCID